jgi:O-antigen/teichoic acid export membrane protein
MEIIRDPFYRGSLVLLANTVSIAVLGFAFWTLAARDYPPAAVGAFSGLSSGLGLLGAVASLGLPNMITRHLAGSDSPRGLLAIALLAITALGGALCAIVVIALGTFLPPSLHLQEQGGSAELLITLVILISLNGALSAGLVALRATQTVLWTNLAGAVTKLAGLIALTSLRSSGLVISFGVGLAVSTLLSVPPLMAKVSRGRGLRSAFSTFRKNTAAVNNYIATILGILPAAIVPLEVIAERGAAQAAPFALAFLMAGFLVIIPSTASRVLFAESSRRGVAMGGQLRKAIRVICVLLLPALIITVAGAPFIMGIFGASYSVAGTSSLRILSLTALPMSGNYLVDSMLIARDRSVAYLFMNGANAALVLGCVGVLLHHGLVGGSQGWALAQSASLLLGLAVIATGRTGRHRRPPSSFRRTRGKRIRGHP